MSNHKPIGIFDSGVGGLTVYKALREALPHEDFVYLGDTARLPYGTKSAETVTQYALQAARLLLGYDIKLLVVACNTASAAALPALQNALPNLPSVGVIDASAEAAAKISANGYIAVLATEGTVRSGAYPAAIYCRREDANVQMLACNLLVALAEEGWSDGIEADAIVMRYLSQLLPGYDTLLLGCTHFPLLIPALQKHVAPNVHIVDSATATAINVKDFLEKAELQNTQAHAGRTRFLVTDSPARFERLAQLFLGDNLQADTVDFSAAKTYAPPVQHYA